MTRWLVVILCLIASSTSAQQTVANRDPVEGFVLSLIPIIHGVSDRPLQQSIQATKVFVSDEIGLNAYATASPNGPEIRIGRGLLYVMYLHASAQAYVNYLQWVDGYASEPGADITKYQQYLIDHLETYVEDFRAGRSYDDEPDSLPQFLGIQESDLNQAIAAAGKIDEYQAIRTDYYNSAVAGILIHEFAHIHLGHVNLDRTLLSNKEKRKQEWEADLEAIGLVAKVAGDPAGMLLLNQIFSLIEHPFSQGDHPSSFCRYIYTLDATLDFMDRDIDRYSLLGVSPDLIAQMTGARDQLMAEYLGARSQFAIQNVCDDYVNLRY